jgi:hypothetical protein
MSRIIGYIDGYNLYNGLRDRNWRQFYWLDPHKLIESLAPRQGIVTSAKYFTARVKGPDDKRGTQTAFLDAINAISHSEMILASSIPNLEGAVPATPRGSPTKKR